MKKVILGCFAALFLIPLMGQTASAQTVKEINFTPIPDVGSGSIKEKFGKITQHIELKTGMKVNLNPVGSYSAVIVGMRKKQVDLSYLGPKGYVEARKRAGAVPLVVELNDAGKPGYHSIIIAKASAGYADVMELKGKKFAFVDPGSTSGGVVPSVYFAKIKLEPKTFFSRVIYSGSHEAAVISLRNNKVHAAVTNDLDFEEGVRAGRWKAENYKVLWKSPVLPGTLFAAGGHLDAATTKALQDALLSFNDQKTFEEMGISGFQRTTDADYDSVRDVIALKKQLAAKQ